MEIEPIEDKLISIHHQEQEEDIDPVQIMIDQEEFNRIRAEMNEA